ncbi:MAG: hypothetical protein ACK5JT_08975 [Hyphomicrobiaceae bacterium]
MSAGVELLKGLQIEHGPIPQLGRFFLLADRLLADAGVKVFRTSLDAAAEAQAANVDSWAMFPPMLDTRLSPISEDESFALLGKDASGDVVCAQAARFYDLGERSFKDIVTDQSFFYGSQIPPDPGMPLAAVTAPSAGHIKGRMLYSGALWVHPKCRGRHLTGVLPRISRAYGVARWNTQTTVGMVREDNMVPKLLASYGYKTIEPRFTITKLAPTTLSWCIMVMQQAELLEDLNRFVEARSSEIDTAVSDSSTEHKGHAVGGRHG